MKLLKEHSYDIIKLGLYQFVTSVFAIILDIPVAAEISDGSLQTKILALVSFLAIVLYYYLIYSTSWEWGAKDKIRVDAGRLEPNKYKGAIVGLAANALNLIMAVILFVCILIGNGASGAVFQVIYYILYIFSFMYYGIFEFAFESLSANTFLNYSLRCAGYFVLPLVAVSVIHLGYILGYKEKRLFASNKNAKNSHK